VSDPVEIPNAVYYSALTYLALRVRDLWRRLRELWDFERKIKFLDTY